MKKIFFLFTALVLLFSCSSDKNSQEFITKTTGNYLFNADEKISIYFKEKVLFVKWRGQDIKPLKINDTTFYVQPLNEKIIFTQNSIQLATKKEHKNQKFVFTKLAKGAKTPREHLLTNNYKKALEGYLKIKEKDSLNPVIQRRNLSKLGYKYLSNNDFKKSIMVFKITTVLYPKSSNSFDSLADAYLKKNDTIKAIENYKKALAINPENRGASRQLKKLTKE